MNGPDDTASPGGDAGFAPSQRLWTPWRMTYVGGAREPGCVFCDALASDDDTESLIVHRGEHAFVILNLYPYNTGHLMVVPNEHVSDLAALAEAARAEMAELTASFCTGLRRVLGCEGLNTGTNLGSAAGAGISDHLHQHIVPRWTGDANFMPIVGGTKVLPELLPATYAKIRAEIARRKSSAPSLTLVMFDANRERVFLENNGLPRVPVNESEQVWRTGMASIAPFARTTEILGWAGPASTTSDAEEAPSLALAFTPHEAGARPFQSETCECASEIIPEGDRTALAHAIARFG